MINFDEYTNEKCTINRGHIFQITHTEYLFAGGSGWGKTNALLN